VAKKFSDVNNEYVKELYAFQAEKGLETGHTKNEVSEGQAMVLFYKNNLGEEETSIFFRSEFIFGLYLAEELKDENKDNITMLFNNFFHEFCHINDDYHTRELFWCFIKESILKNGFFLFGTCFLLFFIEKIRKHLL